MSRTIDARRRRRGGFAMIMAIALVAVVALALGAVLSLFRLDLDRTADALEQAQLRQMLLAGERAARGQLDAAPAEGAPVDAGPVPVALPTELTAGGGALEFRVAPVKAADGATASAEVTVRATLGRRAMAQTLGYEKAPGGWQVVRASLGAPDRS